MLSSHEGGCHCGQVRFRAEVDLSQVSECNCSICVKKGILHLAASRDRFQLLQGEDALTNYQFNTKTAQHTFCRHCGIHPFYVPRLNPDRLSVNARCLDGVDVADLRPTRVFDGKNWEQAAAVHRRQAGEPV